MRGIQFCDQRVPGLARGECCRGNGVKVMGFGSIVNENQTVCFRYSIDLVGMKNMTIVYKTMPA